MKKLILLTILICMFLISCTNTLTPPVVRTISALAQSATTITATGKILSDNGLSIISYGLCLSKDSLPTTSDSKKEHLYGTYIIGNEFSDSFTGLNKNETYYVRAYANNSDGVSYGKSICVKTYFPIIVGTELPTTITLNSAVCSGNISNDSGFEITSSGFCWSTTINPTINNNKTINGKKIGGFSNTLTGLKSNTIYYIKAFVISNNETIYGNEVSFQTTKWDDSMTVTDIDGNIYHTVTIGTQVWMIENLKVKHFIDGDSIPYVTDDDKWLNLTKEGCCDFFNDPSHSYIFGKLYNWNAAKSNRIAPKGWHVSTYDDWKILSDLLGGLQVAGGKLKETGTLHWFNTNVGATNEVGFTALNGGGRFGDNLRDGFSMLTGNWWTNSFEYHTWPEYGTLPCPWLVTINNNDINLSFGYTRLIYWGFSIRCVLD